MMRKSLLIYLFCHRFLEDAKINFVNQIDLGVLFAISLFFSKRSVSCHQTLNHLVFWCLRSMWCQEQMHAFSFQLVHPTCYISKVLPQCKCIFQQGFHVFSIRNSQWYCQIKKIGCPTKKKDESTFQERLGDVLQK